MQFKAPKNTEKYEWTRHAVIKMKQYGLTAQRILRVVKNPQRVEEGIVKNTVAVMQPSSLITKDGKRVWTREIWAMYQSKGKSESENQKTIGLQKIRLISAWRYPGVSPKRDPIPEEILRELDL
ncbi:MAG: hypothetical protein UX02_C0001G0296 [Candidatus Moranbacteria bacterium GW2011_GWC1_45_18]|nr:MAG: hypothetical protein UT79_C0002G0101 [Candidatus Moranbacteria bacterium GW2011_GWC2_40_12]KKT32498.1 MAG: hypothetical protein UW19_C0020G0015 [Candidatus Moranbacteria bacterium GW2011_GWF2_44_10]KKU00848.1 MAG: hypothetical protein UX02_C0001G0296 [Candidatus Moranbacteria bacterium GW2011_GWC1_45_18]